MRNFTKLSYCSWSTVVLLTVLVTAKTLAQPSGQWDFDAGNLTATVGSDLQYSDGPGGLTQQGTQFGTTTGLGIPNINGTPANVMKFPIATNYMGYLMPDPANPNGGGATVNEWTLIMDVLYPTASGSSTRPIIDTDGSIFVPGPDILINTTGGIGLVPGGPFVGSILPNQWYRIGMAVTASSLDLYVNGNQVGSFGGTGLDGQLALTAGANSLILGSTADAAAVGYVNSIQLRTNALNPGQMSALGGPSASGIPQVIPPVPSFIQTRTPAPGSTDILPKPNINVVLNQGDTLVNGGSIQLFFDGALMSASVVATPPTFTVSATETTLLAPNSVHTLRLTWSDNVAGNKTNDWSFTVASYQSIKLPAPFYLENFDAVAEGGLPTGWVATNATTREHATLDLCDPQSISYENWLVINTNRLCGGGPCGGFECDTLEQGPIAVNGDLIDNLAHNNILYFESDNRCNNCFGQIGMLFTTDINCTGRSNVFLSFHSLYTQNQDNIAALEYSIDQGVTWLPVIYYLDDENGTADVIRTNGVVDVGATFNTARGDQAAGGTNYGYFICAPITSALIPYVAGRINDDQVVSGKRIELVRLTQADGQAHVKFRFVYAGACSWYWGVDDFGLYEIGFPIIATQPQSQIKDAGTSVTFTVVATATPPPAYQWLFNGGVIAGATRSSLTFTAETNNAGNYSVIVSNTLDSVVSSTATLTAIAAPHILLQPVSVSANAGVNVGFSAAARGRAPISYQWTRNGVPISGATTGSYAIRNAQLANAAQYACVFSNSDGAITSRAANLKIITNITQDLVVHLKFDGDFNDSSGRGNNGTAVGSPGFVAGKIGQCMQYTDADGGVSQNYVSMDNPISVHPTDLRMGFSVSFSISFWYLVPAGNRHGDPAIVSNKDWDSGSNDGLVLFNSGSGLQWNYREVDDGIDSNQRKDSGGTSPGIEDGNWHHCVVVFNRGGNAATYVDGKLVYVAPLATAAAPAMGGFLTPTTIDNDPSTNRTRTATGAWNIGEDGSGMYTTVGGGHDGPGINVTNACIDDLGIWRRALTPGEVAAVYVAGSGGNALDTAAPVTNPAPLNPAIAISGSNVVITKGNTMLFSAPTLNGPWTEVVAARSVSVYTEPLAGQKYYRGAQP